MYCIILRRSSELFIRNEDTCTYEYDSRMEYIRLERELRPLIGV